MIPREPGIYRVRRPKLHGPGMHYGVLSVQALDLFAVEVIDFRPGGFSRQFIDEWAQGLKVETVDRCPDWEQPIAIQRLRMAVHEGHGYELWSNNCEHVANWVVEGCHTSAQVNMVKELAKIAAVIGLVVLVAKSA